MMLTERSAREDELGPTIGSAELDRECWPIEFVHWDREAMPGSTYVALSVDGKLAGDLFAEDVARWFRYRLFGEGMEPNDDDPTVERVHLGGRWVVLFWSDGTVTKLKPQPGDEYSPLAGVMAMALRKLSRNRVRYSVLDPVTEAVTAGNYSPDMLRLMSHALSVAADAMEADGYDGGYRPDAPVRADGWDGFVGRMEASNPARWSLLVGSTMTVDGGVATVRVPGAFLMRVLSRPDVAGPVTEAVMAEYGVSDVRFEDDTR